MTHLSSDSTSPLTWYIRGAAKYAWSRGGDVAAPANYVGDKRTDLAVVRHGSTRQVPLTWYVRGLSWVEWGYSGSGISGGGDVAVPANYIGDSHAEIAVWRPSNGTWYVRGASSWITWGRDGDWLVPGNYIGDSHADIAVWRWSTGTWYIRTL